MNKELQIRRRVQNIYNKSRDGFPTLREYNDYLELVEDIIFSLIEGVDVAATEAKLLKYQNENADAIIASRARRAEEEATLLSSGRNFVASDAAGIDPQMQQQSGISAASTAAAPSGKYAPTTVIPRPIAQLPVPVGPPSCNSNREPEDEQTRLLREEKALRAGGWSMDFARRRACEEAISSLWIS